MLLFPSCREENWEAENHLKHKDLPNSFYSIFSCALASLGGKQRLRSQEGRLYRNCIEEFPDKMTSEKDHDLHAEDVMNNLIHCLPRMEGPWFWKICPLIQAFPTENVPLTAFPSTYCWPWNSDHKMVSKYKWGCFWCWCQESDRWSIINHIFFATYVVIFCCLALTSNC